MARNDGIFSDESEKNSSGCFWKIVIIGGLIIGAYCFIREKMDDKKWEREIAEREERAKNPRPIKKQKPVVHHYHRCSVCKEEYSEEGEFPNRVFWCERCEKWHCGGCTCPQLL